MKRLPKTENPLVLRTDFSNQAAWEKICAAIQKPVGLFRFRANVEFLSDRQYEGVDRDQLLALLLGDYPHTFIFLVDPEAISRPAHPVLVIDLFERSGREFRTVPRQAQGIENNLSLGNMDFEDFTVAVGADGVFRGFPGPWWSRLLAG